MLNDFQNQFERRSAYDIPHSGNRFRPASHPKLAVNTLEQKQLSYVGTFMLFSLNK